MLVGRGSFMCLVVFWGCLFLKLCLLVVNIKFEVICFIIIELDGI